MAPARGGVAEVFPGLATAPINRRFAREERRPVAPTAAQQAEPMNWRREGSGTADFLLMGGQQGDKDEMGTAMDATDYFWIAAEGDVSTRRTALCARSRDEALAGSAARPAVIRVRAAGLRLPLARRRFR